MEEEFDRPLDCESFVTRMKNVRDWNPTKSDLHWNKYKGLAEQLKLPTDVFYKRLNTKRIRSYVETRFAANHYSF